MWLLKPKFHLKIVLVCAAFLAFWPFATAQAQKSGKPTNLCGPVFDLILNTDEEDNPFFDEPLNQPDLLTVFYTQRNCTPAWYSTADSFARYRQIQSILQEQSYLFSDLHIEKTEARYAEIESIYLPIGLFYFDETGEFDIMVSDAALTLAYNLSRSITGAQPMKLPVMLEEALEKGTLETFFGQLEQGRWPGKQPDEAPADTVKAPLPPVPADKTGAKIQQQVNDSALYKLVLSLTNPPRKTSLLGDMVLNPDLVTEFYRRNNFTPAWHSPALKPDATNIEQLLKALNAAASEGLEPTHYHSAKINTLWNAVKTGSTPPDTYPFEVLLTDAALHYGAHLNWGKVNPNSMPFRWDFERETTNLPAMLQTDLSKKDIATFFDKLKPQHPQYQQLKNALAEYRQKLADGISYPTVPEGAGALKPGMRDTRIAALRLRLAEEYLVPQNQFNDLLNPADTLKPKNKLTAADSTFNNNLYDPQLLTVVKLFQQHHGLEPDGVIGRQTLLLLNASVTDQIDQILINLEKWRWLPNYLGDKYLLVNIPSFLLRVYEPGNNLALTKRVVTGAVATPTPLFSEQLLFIEFNPLWGVPFSIATKEILPKLKRNPGYLNAHDMELYSGESKINPYKVNWANVSAKNFRYTIRQKPGDNNALGLVKFLFPNQYDVYLHDTPSKSLFANAQRAYSHGCIRLEKPLELAEYLLAPDISREKIADIVAKGKNKRVYVPEPRPIYILYFTTWVEETDNSIYFYPDVYGRDKNLLYQF